MGLRGYFGVRQFECFAVSVRLRVCVCVCVCERVCVCLEYLSVCLSGRVFRMGVVRVCA